MTDTPAAAARLAKTVRNRRRVRDTWRDHQSDDDNGCGQARSRDHHLGRVGDIYNASFDFTRRGNAPLLSTPP